MSFDDFEISSMFDFKQKEHIEECYKMLSVNKIEITDKTVIDIKNSDGLIDLSPCVGINEQKIAVLMAERGNA